MTCLRFLLALFSPNWAQEMFRLVSGGLGATALHMKIGQLVQQ